MRIVKKLFFGLGMALLFMITLANCHKDTYTAEDPKILNAKVDAKINEATFSWTVDYPGKVSSVIALSRKEDMSDAVRYGSEDATDNKNFSATAVGLTEDYTYYYQYLVWTPTIEFKSEVKSFTTGQYYLPTVTTSKVTDITGNSATCGGSVTMNDDSELFEKGICWGTEHNPTINGTHASSEEGLDGFTINMTGLTEGVTYYVRAYATNIKGTAYGNEVDFFTKDPSPEGTINGLFSVSETQQVYFSMGNLQYAAVYHDIYSPTTYGNLWRFASKQREFIGMANTNIASNYNGYIDLFAWGTSMFGTINGMTGDPNPYAYPYETTFIDGTINGLYYGPTNNDLTYPYQNYDWGVYNAILNGGNEAGLWRTLTINEWKYVLNSRSASTVNGTENARFAKGSVNGVYGVILFPDQYIHPERVLPPYGINAEDASGWVTNSYSDEDWELMEIAGAVFLPAAGFRKEKNVFYVNVSGVYWSATHYESPKSFEMVFSETGIGTNYVDNRGFGLSVRLVMDFNDNKQ